jgi:hypothetical protein
MRPDMRKKVRSYLKGLAENRARSAGDVLRLEAMAAQVTQALVEARLDLESCDRLIRKYDPRLRPERIEPIREWRHHKGKRGELRQLLLEIIQREAPAPLTLIVICCEIEMRWELTFLTDLDRISWRRDSVARALRSLVVKKKIAALHTMKGGHSISEVARWTAT